MINVPNDETVWNVKLAKETNSSKRVESGDKRDLKPKAGILSCLQVQVKERL